MTATVWIQRAKAVTDAELTEFRRGVCVARGHIGTAVIGSCSRCGGATSSGSMSLCERCAGELGVCQYDGRLTGWGSESAREAEAMAARWLALLLRGYSNEREAAARALAGFPLAGLAEAVAQAGDEAPAGGAPATAEFIVGFHGELPDGVTEGSSFHGAPIVRVNPVLRSALVLPTDARVFEERARGDSRVAFVDLNRQTAELGD